MNNIQFVLGLIIAVGIVIVSAEAAPEIVNALLILILVGIVLSRWGEIEPWMNLAGKVAGGAGFKGKVG